MNIKTAQDGRIKKHLSSVIRYCNQTMCVDTWLIGLKEDGYIPEEKQVPAVQYNRIKYNRMTGEEQAQYEKRLNEKKTEYRAVRNNTILVLNKIEYDFFNGLFEPHY